MFVEIKSNIESYYSNGCLPFIVNSVGYMKDQVAMNRPLGFECHHLLWITDGVGEFTVGNSTFTLSSHCGLLMRGKVPHRYKAASGHFGTGWITFYGLDRLLDRYGIKECFTFKTSDTFEASVKELYRHAKGNSTIVSRAAAGFPIVTEFLESCFASDAPLSDKVARYLEANFSSELSLGDIAAAVGLNKYTLCKKFSAETGSTVIDELRRIRVAKAKRYLIDTSYSVEKVGKMCGFDSPSYFGKVFKDISGVSPKEYRNKYL